MLLVIPDVLDADDLSSVAGRLPALVFKDGKATAGLVARAVKHNEQASGNDAANLADFVRKAVERHPVVQKAARPARFGPTLISRYHPGMAYGRHVDNPYLEGVRSDLSFTLFLNPPESYNGGELALDLPGGRQTIKLPAGSLVLYPSTSIHEVLPVTSGARLACVGWIESRVRLGEAREALFDLANVRALLAAESPAEVTLTEARLLLQKAEANLLRLLG